MILPSRILIVLGMATALTRGQEIALAPPSLPELCAQYEQDRGALNRLLPFPFSEARLRRLQTLHESWLSRLDTVDFDSLPRPWQVDWLLLRHRVQHDLDQLATTRFREEEAAELIPFLAPLVVLVEDRAQRKFPSAESCATVLHEASAALQETRKVWQEEDKKSEATVARRAAQKLGTLRQSLGSWFQFRSGYDPLFTWWCAKPWEDLEKELKDYGKFLQKDLAGIDLDDKDLLLGDPIGEDALLQELAFERIPYSPAELIDIAEREFAWCNARREEAATQLGLDKDWKAAQASAKKLHVAPGEQPALILELSDKAIQFLEDRQLLTIPDLAKESWRMEMMSPERQKFSPYFTGGEVISVSFPTDSMDHEAKLQSMRGNNQPYSNATVHHELIPGHHLQGYMSKRWNPHRRMFSTPFSIEGWALYWELRLWDLEFPQTPEEKIGMLFWRSHRCARILFSLNFHLGIWSAEECVDFLVENVGHERKNAEAEVRRSIQGGYGPLYQCAYMLGGLQIRALHQELVQNGNWTDRQFHDAVLRQGPIPIEFLRAALDDQPLNRDFPVRWRFDS